jgi:hypothetical protein
MHSPIVPKPSAMLLPSDCLDDSNQKRLLSEPYKDLRAQYELLQLLVRLSISLSVHSWFILINIVQPLKTKRKQS